MKDSSPKVTVLMPVYNGEKYIKFAIDSILNQTYTNFELLIINDGSTDNTQQIIESFNDSRIRSIQQSNHGVAKTLNKGIKLVNTEYIRRHDADDFSEPKMLEEQMQFLGDHPDIEFVSSRCAFMTDRGKVAYTYTQPKINLFETNEEYLLVTREMFNPYSPIVHGTVLGPTAIFKEMNGYRTEFLTSEDNDLWLRIIEKYKFAVLKRPFYYLRLNITSATQMHKTTVEFYRNLCLQFADDRATRGSDALQLGQAISIPKKKNNMNQARNGFGKKFRTDIFDFNYPVNINAKDYHNIIKNIYFAIRDGWRLSSTYKAILLPWLNEKWIKKGVELKQILNS